MARTYFSDERWAVVEKFLLEDGHKGPKGNLRTFFEAVFYWHRTGVPWRDLPEEFGKWKSIYNRFNRWSEAGKWERFFQFLKQSKDNRWHSIDSTINRAHQHAAGQKKAGQVIPLASVVAAGRQNCIWLQMPKGVH
jgi:transposase